MIIRRITVIALFTATALIIHTAEAFIPVPLPVPGVKLGLANIVTLFMLFMPENRFFNPKTADVFVVLLCRIILGSLIAGRPVMMIYSLTGGLTAVTVQLILKRVITGRQIWVCGAAGATVHNAGQVIAAVIITGTPAIALYLPVLIIAGIITGIMTGLTAQFTLMRIKTIIR